MITVSSVEQETAKSPKRRLENRLNDLPWKEWLIFQKSFFRLSDDNVLFKNIIEFFTKTYRADGHPSRVLILSFDHCSSFVYQSARILEQETFESKNLKDWPTKKYKSKDFDLLVLDMRAAEFLRGQNIVELRENLISFYAECSGILRPSSFCAVLSCEMSYILEEKEQRYPLPWLLASSARSNFRLRDEKVGIDANAESEILYVNILQAVDEIGPMVSPSDIVDIAIGNTASREQWIIPRPKSRQKKEILHPAKFPEDLVTRFLCELSKPGDIILDPMGGTGSVAVASLQTERKPVIVELDENWVDIAQERILGLTCSPLLNEVNKSWFLAQGDARDVLELIPEEFRPINYTVTSPPYWRILHNAGMHEKGEGQKARRAKGLATTYSDSMKDLGNIRGYEQFINDLAVIYENISQIAASGAILTIVTKNVKYERAVYPIAWDLVFRLCNKQRGLFEYAGTTFWCQDDIRLKPFGMGCDWISNILHHYCIHLRVRK